MRIVYVEDNIANVHLVKRVARIGKHEIINYIDGMDAFNNFATDDPDLVLMDIQLAGELTGIEVVKKLRDKGFTTPIFAVTAYAMVGDKERCMEAGCTGYMSKPIPIPDLVKLFEKYDKPKPPIDVKQADNSVSEIPDSVAQSPSPEIVATSTPTPIATTEQTQENSDLPKTKPASEVQGNQTLAEGDDKLKEEDSTTAVKKSDGKNNIPTSINKDKPAQKK
jgi:CheY-like chemotaxis protein